MDDQTILARVENFGTVSVCPGGIVHINLPHCAVKFLPSDFAKFCDLIAQARARFEAPKRSIGKPHLQVVGPESDEDTTPPQDK